MIIFYEVLDSVESLDDIPDRAVIRSVDGRLVSGKCGVCNQPVFVDESKIEEAGQYWHKICVEVRHG